MGLKNWWKRRQEKRKYEDWLYFEWSRLKLQERKTLLKTAKINLKFQKYQWKMMKKEEKRTHNYIS